MDVAERLAVGGLDHALAVEAARVGESCDLIRERDVHVAVGRLGELRQLRGLRRAHRPHGRAEERLVELDAALLAGIGQAAHELRVGLEVPEDPAAEDALGAEHGEEVLLAGEPAGRLECGRDPLAGGADRERRLDADGRPGLQPAADVSDDGVKDPPVDAHGVVDHQRRHGDHEVRTVGDGRRGVRDGAQAARGDELGQGVLEPRLTGERLEPLVDEVHDPLVDVAADDLVPSTGDGDGEGQPDLAERDDDDAHQPAVASATGRTVSPLDAASRTASA